MTDESAPEEARATHERLEAEREAMSADGPAAEDAQIGEIAITFLANGNMNVGFNNVKVPQIWGASRLLDTIATRMWNEQRDASLAMEAQARAEMQAAMAAIRRPTDFMGKGGKPRQ